MVKSTATRPLPDNPIRDAIREMLIKHPRLRPHPAQERETKYISAFIGANGGAFALDKNSASEQPIWVEAHAIADGALKGIRAEFYPAGRGRNSNLHKLPGFKDGALQRFYPRGVDDALKIVSHVLSRATP